VATIVYPRSLNINMKFKAGHSVSEGPVRTLVLHRQLWALASPQPRQSRMLLISPDIASPQPRQSRMLLIAAASYNVHYLPVGDLDGRTDDEIATTTIFVSCIALGSYNTPSHLALEMLPNTQLSKLKMPS
jgi:hypothetical protein